LENLLYMNLFQSQGGAAHKAAAGGDGSTWFLFSCREGETIELNRSSAPAYRERIQV